MINDSTVNATFLPAGKDMVDFGFLGVKNVRRACESPASWGLASPSEGFMWRGLWPLGSHSTDAQALSLFYLNIFISSNIFYCSNFVSGVNSESQIKNMVSPKQFITQFPHSPISLWYVFKKQKQKKCPTLIKSNRNWMGCCGHWPLHWSGRFKNFQWM